jgi:hypothetical protein
VTSRRPQCARPSAGGRGAIRCRPCGLRQCDPHRGAGHAPGRVAAVSGGLPAETPAFTLNRLCGSGLQAIASAAQAIRLGDCHVVVAGGAESMSRVGLEYSIVGGDLRLPVAAWSCQAAIWPLCERCSATCLRRRPG